MTNISAVEKMAELMQQIEVNSPRVAALHYCLSETARHIAELEQKLAESQREFRAADATIENLQMQLEKMAAENAGLKEACGGDGSYRDCPACAHSEYIEAPETPTTDAFLAEVRAQGVESAIDTAKNVVAQEFQYKDFETAQRVCSKFPESDLVGKVEMVEWLADFAAQLRKGVQS
ncbi:hypothetical protein [Enterobacter cloacae]|uniref:hypothetical protein n=1 Tax=Enterobacter cloacae TaxID=550 RepID=UPI0020045F28|nr:hypothetical protein [Enterobacter cloacae]MCK7163283.1 hypothetical protein [Enterobacter cloacae]